MARRLKQLILQVTPCEAGSKSGENTDGPERNRPVPGSFNSLTGTVGQGTKPSNDPSGLWGRGYEHSNVREKLPKVPKGVTFDQSMKQKYVEFINKRRSGKGMSQFVTLGSRDSQNDKAFFEVLGDDVDEDPYVEKGAARAAVNRDVTVVVCGMGFGGILCGARMTEAGFTDMITVDKGGDVGGTWYWNRYPGIACDVESYAYMPLLEACDYIPTMKFASGFEIQEHARRIMEKYDLYKTFMGQTTVTSTTWNEAEKKWTVGTDKNDVIKAKFVIFANGTMTVPKLCKLPGMENFKGVSFHSSRWDYSHDLRGKKVGIIGTGCTACQAIPELAKVVSELYVFQRTPSSIDVRNNIRTSPEMEAKFRSTPGWDKNRRDVNDAALGEGPLAKPKAPRKKVSDMTQAERDEVERKKEEANFQAIHAIRLRVPQHVKDPKTAESLTPWYTLGSKRPVFHDEYLSTYNKPHVHLVDTDGKGVEAVSENGPVANGQEYPVEVLIYATGFEHMIGPVFNTIRGRNGMTLAGKWADGTKTFLGTHSVGFPNLFIINGPQAAGATFNMLSMCDHQCVYMANLMKTMKEKGLDVVDIDPVAEEKFVEHCIDTDKRNTLTRYGEYAAISYYNWEGTKRFGDSEYFGGHKYFAFEDESLAALNGNGIAGDKILETGELRGVQVYHFN